MTASLFPDLVPVDLTPPETAEKLSAGRRLTLRQKADVERGRHPLTRGPLANNGETCGTCVHRVLSHWHTRSYPKCALGIDPQTEPLDRAPLRRTPLTRVSRKRARQLREYTRLRREFLEARPVCEFPGEFSEGCLGRAVEIHHRRGRVGADLVAVEHWSALCSACHKRVTERPAEAYELGLSERRIGRAS